MCTNISDPREWTQGVTDPRILLLLPRDEQLRDETVRVYSHSHRVVCVRYRPLRLMALIPNYI